MVAAARCFWRDGAPAVYRGPIEVEGYTVGETIGGFHGATPGVVPPARPTSSPPHALPPPSTPPPPPQPAIALPPAALAAAWPPRVAARQAATLMYQFTRLGHSGSPPPELNGKSKGVKDARSSTATQASS